MVTSRPPSRIRKWNKYPNETNTLKPVQLNHQMAFCIWGRPHWIPDGKLNTLGYFLLFLIAGLVDVGSESPNCSNAPNIENFGVFALYPCYFFSCCLAVKWPNFGYYWGNSLTNPMLITAFGLSIFSRSHTLRAKSQRPSNLISIP